MADNYTFKDASGAALTHSSKDIGAGVQVSEHVSVDDAGVMIAKAEDAAHTTGDKGIMALAVRRDTPTSMVNADGDYIPLTVDSSGRLHVTSNDNATAGDVAHDAADSGNPLKIGGKAATSTPSAVSAGDRVNAYFDASGRLIIDSDTIRALLPASLGAKAASAGLAVTLANDQTSADNGTLPTSGLVAISGYTQALENSAASGVAAGKSAAVRMTTQRELLVATRARWAYASAADVTYAADLTAGVTSAYSTFVALTAAFLDGADVGFDASARWVRIPMFEQNRGVCFGLYHNLGVNLTVAIRADLTGHANISSVQRPVIDTVVVASGGYVWFSPFPLAEGANASMRYVPMLNMPMRYLVAELTPASDPASGGITLAVSR